MKTWQKVVLIALLSIALLGSGIFLLVISILKSTDPYKQTVTLVQASPKLKEKLGEPVKIGWFPMGEVNKNLSGGNADLTLGVSGPKGEGKVHAIYKKEGDAAWEMLEANYLAKGETPLSIAQLEIKNITFFRDSLEGEPNPEKKYKKGESAFWKVDISRFKIRDGVVSLKEGLAVFDEENNIVAENPDLILFEEKIDAPVVTFDNHAALPDAGVYRIVMTFTDNVSGESVQSEEKVTIEDVDGLVITGLSYRDGAYDGDRKEKAVYWLSEPVFMTFNVVGATIKAGKVHIVEDLAVKNVKGEKVLDQPGILTVNEPWGDADLLSLQNRVDVPEPGVYDLEILIKDVNAGTESKLTGQFEIQDFEEEN